MKEAETPVKVMLKLWFHNMAELSQETGWLENNSNEIRKKLLQTQLKFQM